MRRAVRTVLIAAFAIGMAQAALANLDTDGYVMDGKTTYCEGVSDPKAPLVFDKQLVKSAGNCPIALTLTQSIRRIDATNTIEVWIDWQASFATINASRSLFPRVIDKETGLPKPVIASLLQACKVGSNCKTNADVVVPAPAVDTATTTGSFDEDGDKPLRRFVFGFPGVVDHIIVAKVVLPGDPTLNISATEFLAFLRVQVGAANTPFPPGTVKPFAQGNLTGSLGGMIGSDASNMRTVILLTPKPTPSPVANRTVNASSADTGSLTSGSTGSKTNVIVLSAIGGLGCVVALAYFVVVKKRKNTNQPAASLDDNDQNPSIYRLTDAAKDITSIRYSTRRQTEQPVRRPFQPRQPVEAPWRAPAPVPPQSMETKLTMSALNSNDSIDSASDLLISQSTFNSLHDSTATATQLTSFNSLNDSAVTPRQLTSFNSLHDSTATARQLTSFNSLHDSTTSSMLDSTASSMLDSSMFDSSTSSMLTGETILFNSLHDSSVALPVVREHRRRMSSGSLCVDDLEEGDEDELLSSDLFSASHLSERGTALTENRSTVISNYSLLSPELRSGSDLEFMMPVHERTKRL